MITGSVNSELEAIVRLTVAGSGSRQRDVDAVVDTGFTGYLTLRPSTITALQLTWLGREQGTLADGSVDLFDVYRGTVIWDGTPRPVEVEAANVDALVGMAMLERHSLNIDVVSCRCGERWHGEYQATTLRSWRNPSPNKGVHPSRRSGVSRMKPLSFANLLTTC